MHTIIYQYNDLCMKQLQSASFENDAAVAVKTVPDDAHMEKLPIHRRTFSTFFQIDF